MHAWFAEKSKEDCWSEQDWERFLAAEAVSRAKFLELSETLKEHPQRERVIAEEMGWAEVLDRCRSEHRHCGQCGREMDCELHQVCRFWSAAAGDAWSEDSAPLDWSGLEEVEAYRRTRDFSLEVSRRLSSLMDAEAGTESLALAAISAACRAAALVARARPQDSRGFSFADHLEGCRRAQQRLDDCRRALLALQSGLPAQSGLAELLALADDAQRGIEEWVRELESFETSWPARSADPGREG